MAIAAISFQPDLIGVMSQFSQFEATLKKHLAIATEKSAGLIGDQQVADMWINFKEPTGALEDSVSVVMVDAYMAYIGPTLIYGPRRNWGFVGKFDVLGRGPFGDGGIHYAEFSISDSANLQNIAQYYIEQVYAAWEECIGNIPGGTAAFVSTAA